MKRLSPLGILALVAVAFLTLGALAPIASASPSFAKNPLKPGPVSPTKPISEPISGPVRANPVAFK